MHTHLLRAALAATMVLLPLQTEAQTSGLAARPPHQGAEGVVGRLLAHQQQLALTSGQIDALRALADRIRTDRGRLQIAGLDRVPGKSVPRFARVYAIRRAAKETAFRLLTPEQLTVADELLRDHQVKTACR